MTAQNGPAAAAAAVRDHSSALAAIQAVAAGCSGHVGLAARHIESGQSLAWQPDRPVQTASTIKVPIHAALMRRVRLGQADLDAVVELKPGDQTGGSGVLAVLRPGLRCTVADLCTLMIVVSDNTATNMLIDICGGVDVINADLAELGFGDIRLYRKIGYSPPPLVAADRDGESSAEAPAAEAPAAEAPPAEAPADEAPAGRTLATASPADLCRLMIELQAGTVVDARACAEIIEVMRHQQSQSLFPRAFLDVAEPGDQPGPLGPAMAHKTGSVGGCRVETGLLFLPDDGGTVAYAAAADELSDKSMTALAEGNEVLGRLGAIVLSHWWPGPGPVPVRRGWLPRAD